LAIITHPLESMHVYLRAGDGIGLAKGCVGIRVRVAAGVLLPDGLA
jgi:hypothetical protein